MTQQVQKRNAQMVDLLRQDFQHRREPNYAWSRAVSMYQALPGLRAFWPMSSVDYTAANRAIDLSGQGNHMTAHNVPTFNVDGLAPYAEFDGTNQYMSRVDGGAANWADITGLETYIDAGIRGFTVGGWFWRDSGTINGGMICKSLNAVSESWWLEYGTAILNAYTFRVWDALNRSTVSVINTVVDEWLFVVGRFNPGVTQTIFVNDIPTQIVAGVRPSIIDSAADVTIGVIRPPASILWNGRASMCFLCAARLSDAIILSLFEQTRAMYGV